MTKTVRNLHAYMVVTDFLVSDWSTHKFWTDLAESAKKIWTEVQIYYVVLEVRAATRLSF